MTARRKESPAEGVLEMHYDAPRDLKISARGHMFALMADDDDGCRYRPKWDLGFSKDSPNWFKFGTVIAEGCWVRVPVVCMRAGTKGNVNSDEAWKLLALESVRGSADAFKGLRRVINTSPISGGEDTKPAEPPGPVGVAYGNVRAINTSRSQTLPVPEKPRRTFLTILGIPDKYDLTVTSKSRAGVLQDSVFCEIDRRRSFQGDINHYGRIDLKVAPSEDANKSVSYWVETSQRQLTVELDFPLRKGGLDFVLPDEDETPVERVRRVPTDLESRYRKLKR